MLATRAEDWRLKATEGECVHKKFATRASGKAHTPLEMYDRVQRLPPGGRDALRKYAGGIFLAKAGSKLCLRPGPKAGDVGD